MRPDRVIAFAGTHTEVGKTWTACAVIAAARQAGLTVAARKPAQSFVVDAQGTPDAPTDAELLALATGEAAEQVCPRHRWYGRAMAPPMAADALGAPPIALGDLEAELRWPTGVALGVVETAGGVRSPLAHDGDNVEFLRRLQPDTVVLVADAGLGVINAVRSAVDALDGFAVRVLLNRYRDDDELHRRNRDWLVGRDGLDVRVDVAGLW